MKIGTSSLRRKLQSKFFLEATEIVNLNGNVDTRVKKLNDGRNMIALFLQKLDVRGLSLI